MNQKIKFIVPNVALLKFNKNDVGSSLFCNSFFNGKKYGGLLLVCDNDMLKRLNVKANQANIFTPEFAFRMYSSKQLFFMDYLFEFEIKLHEGDKSTKLHLHQDSKSFRDFCKSTIKHKAFGLLFQNVDTGLLIASYLNLQDDEDLDWLERNFELSKNQLSGRLFNKLRQWGELSKYIQKEDKESSTYFLHNEKVDSLDVIRDRKSSV